MAEHPSRPPHDVYGLVPLIKCITPMPERGHACQDARNELQQNRNAFGNSVENMPFGQLREKPVHACRAR